MGLTPSALVGFNTTTLFNADDQSLRELAVVNWSIMDDLDFQFGTNFGAGGAGSEFEGFKNPQNGKMFENPDFVFAFLKAYF